MAEERVRPPWWLRYVNKVMIGLNKLGIGGSKGPVVLTVAGRKSGKPRSTPVTPMTVDGLRYVVGGLPGADWTANARAAGEATMNQGRRAQTVRMVEVPTEQARPLLRQFPILVPTGVGFMKNQAWSPDRIPMSSKRWPAAARFSGSTRCDYRCGASLILLSCLPAV